MKKFKKNFILLIVLLVFCGWLFAAAAPALAAGIFEQMKDGFIKMTDSAYGGETGTSADEKTFLNSLIDIINYLLTFLGLVFFLIILYAGWLWLTARGNSEEVEKAKKIFQEAIIALIIVFFARLITELVLSQIGKAIYAQ